MHYKGHTIHPYIYLFCTVISLLIKAFLNSVKIQFPTKNTGLTRQETSALKKRDKRVKVQFSYDLDYLSCRFLN